MSTWFRGRLEGHYVGTGATGPFVSQFGSAARYKMRIYQAVIQDVEEFESEEMLGDNDSENRFFQAEIADVRLLGVRPQRCFEGTVYDVALSGMRVTHSTKKGAKTYGRVVGEVIGRYLLPEVPDDADADIEELALSVVDPSEDNPSEDESGKRASADSNGERAVVDVRNFDSDDEEGEKPVVDLRKSDSDEEERPVVDLHRTKSRNRNRTSKEKDEDIARDIEPLHPPSLAKDTGKPGSNVPVPLLGFLLCIVLGLAGGVIPALLWVGVLFPILMIRWMLSGQFKVTYGQRVFGAILVLINLGCLGWLGLDWWTVGHISINVAALSGLALTVLISSVLPSPGPLLMTGGGLAMVLFLWFGPVNDRPLEEASFVETSEEGTPSVAKPGKPRTNKDGSWPYRGK